MLRFFCVIFACGVLWSQSYSAVIYCRKPEWFRCNNNRCISFLFECDGEDDCGDMSDETNCTDFKLVMPVSVKCATDEYQCKDSSCIPVEKFCDNKSDCSDKSDEYEGCVKELKCETFRCNDGYCVRNEWVCDGTADCPDNSDELNCENNRITAGQCNNEFDRYLCKNQRCILLDAVCNNKDDCGDESDEDTDGCKNAITLCERTAHCTHYCRRTPNGAVCSCRPGYKLFNNRTCIDINECEIYGTCDQHCTNTPGSYDCTCQSGYILQDDKKTCKVEGGEALMIFSSKSEIRGFYLESEVYYPILRNLQHVLGVSLDSKYIYWSDIQEGDEVIVRSLEDGSQREVIVTTGLSTPEDIAVDWITGNVYFTDSGYMRIGVCTTNGSYCTIIIKEGMNKPRGLALLPSNGVMYWADWGSKPHIGMAGMDGEDIRLFVKESLEWPNSLAIDHPNSRLYWIDAKLKIIESIRLDGTDRRTVLHQVAKHPYSLAIFENKLYWSDWHTNTIQSCNKFSGKDWKIVVRENTTLYGIHIYHSVLKPKHSNPCNGNPCSQLCLLNRNNSYTCACTLDKELSTDRHTCRVIKKKEHMVIAAGNTFVDYYHDLLGKPKMTTIFTLKHVTALTYDSTTGTVLGSDSLMDKIFRFDTNSGEMKSVISVKNELLGGMDFDDIGNNLYWSDIEHRTIEVHSFTTYGKTVFYFQNEPLDIALVSEKGIMFVVFRAGSEYYIERMQMNGGGLRVPIANGLVGPKVSLYYDKELQQIFWADQGSGRIQSSSLNGLDKYTLRTGLSEPVSLAILGDNIFWTQRGSNRLYWTDKNSNNRQKNKRIALHVPKGTETIHLVALHAIYSYDKDGCQKNNGNCSHVCLPSGLRSYSCACPPEMILSLDNQTCDVESACPRGQLKCSGSDTCIKFEQRCNSIKDCPNGEDELSGCGQINSCEEDQFACKTGECISMKKRCDSKFDCRDRSDEENCSKKECQSNEFQCREGTCIQKQFVCDGRDDCPDLSDELNCASHTCGPSEFKCESQTCIPESWKCDGQNDCPDGSDEDEQCRLRQCEESTYTCRNGRCIDILLKCNGIDDCGDNTDETHCTQRENGQFANCTENEYKCYDVNVCLPTKVRCNGIQDCPGNDDERDCDYCLKNEFTCDNRKCIPESWVCDKSDDCGDKSDEKECNGNTAVLDVSVGSSSKCEEFRCGTGTCIPYSRVCDELPDCPDGSDEFGKCATSCVKDNPCRGICHKTPSGPVCSCKHGYHLDVDGVSCVDVNECDETICSQLCYNTPGSFVCSCYEGYVLRNDRTSCKTTGSQMEIITATKADIRKLSSTLSSITVIHREMNFDIAGLDVNAREETIYWSNAVLGIISKININTKEKKIVSGVGRPEALSVDWVTDSVYFSDSERPYSLKVCNLEEEKCATVHRVTGIDKVMSVIVDPKNGFLFWSQTGWRVYDSPSGEIYRSNTLGSNATVIAHRNIGVVTSMAIDYTKFRLYWADTFFKTIESSNLDGGNRETFLKTTVYLPLAINIYEDSIYWLMGISGHLQKCKLHGDRSCTISNVGPSNIDRHFAILHIIRQPFVKNTCENNKCSYMCILKNNSQACICQDGIQKESSEICTNNSNTKIRFTSSNAQSAKKNIRHETGTFVGIIITVVASIVILSGYYYYQKAKFNSSNKHELSIHFQNPSYDRRSDVTHTNRTSGLCPGENEYTNPFADIKVKNNCQETYTKKRELVHSDYLETEDLDSNQHIRLVH